MMKHWTAEEKQFVIENDGKMQLKEIGAALGRTENTVKLLRYRLGLCAPKKPWTEDEKQYILSHKDDMMDKEIATALERNVESVGAMRRDLAGQKLRPWTPEDEDYLREYWGTVSVSGLCKNLGRTKNAIMVRVQRLGLPPYLESGEYVTMHQLIIALGYRGSDGYKTKSWIENRGFPVHKKRRGDISVKVVYLNEFWEWAEKHRSFIDFSNMEPLALGEEPDWLPQQRSKDFKALSLQRKDPWTPGEDARLIMLLKQQRYGYAELSNMLHRSAGAIQRRCIDLGLKERPVKADNNGEGVAWTQEDYDILADGIRNGDSYMSIGKAIGKSEKAVRGRAYFVYLTESADKIRAMMGDRPWGGGAPEPTVRQGFNLSRTRTEVRKDLSILDALLRKRMNDLGYDPYWQRFMCMKWDDVKGCSAGCVDCDSCAEFERIKPQYCRVCGATIIDRTFIKWRVCERCKTVRKKQYQRRWARTHQSVVCAATEINA